MPDHTPIDWDEVKMANQKLQEADPFIQEWIKVQEERWNDLLFKLGRLANPGFGYEGEDSDELVEKIKARLNHKWWQLWRQH